jgi:hypothetical protein
VSAWRVEGRSVRKRCGVCCAGILHKKGIGEIFGKGRQAEVALRVNNGVFEMRENR